MVLGVTVMYSQSYNMFADSLLPLFFFFAVFSSLLSMRLAVALARPPAHLGEEEGDSDSALVRRRLADKKLQAGQVLKHGKAGEDGVTARDGGGTTRRVKGKGKTLTAMFSKHHHLNIKHEKHSFHRTVPHEVMGRGGECAPASCSSTETGCCDSCPASSTRGRWSGTSSSCSCSSTTPSQTGAGRRSSGRRRPPHTALAYASSAVAGTGKEAGALIATWPPSPTRRSCA